MKMFLTTSSWNVNNITLPPEESARQGRRAAIRFARKSRLSIARLAHPAATASDLPATRGGKFQNPNANGDLKAAQPPHGGT